MIGYRLPSMCSNDFAAPSRETFVWTLSYSTNTIDLSTILVKFVAQTVELGEASPKEDYMRPAENPYMSSQVPPTLGDAPTLIDSSDSLKLLIAELNSLGLPAMA